MGEAAGQEVGVWRLIGGREGGTVSAVAFSPAFDADQTAFAATLAGVHVSTDGGRTWRGSSQGLLNPFVDAIVLSPDFAADRTLFIGGRDSGVSRSTDGGRTWEPLPFWSATLPSITALVISPGYPANGTLYAGAENGLVYRSTNRGRTWDASGRGLPGAAVLALAVTTGSLADTVIAGTTEGLYRSEDGGRTWRSSGLDGLVVQAVLLAPDVDRGGSILVGTENQGVLRSTDGGETWRPWGTGLTDPCVNGLAISSTFEVDRLLLAATAGGLFRSSDGGERWQATGQDGSVLSVALAPTRTDAGQPSATVALAGAARSGILRSVDAGATWMPANHGLTARLMVALVLSPAFAEDHTMFACSLEEGIQRSRDGGRTWEAIDQGLTSLEVSGLAISPAFASDQVLVAATGAGVAISRSGGDQWLLTGGPAVARAVALAPTFAGIGPLLAAGADGSLHLSPDAGLTWQVLPTPFASEEVTVVAFSPGYAEDASLFAATSRTGLDGRPGRAAIWWSLGRPDAWEAAMEAAGETRWLTMALPPTYPRDGAFYIGLADRVLRPMRRAVESRLGRRRPIWISERPGGRLTTVVGLTISPNYQQDSTVFAATSSGVYVSRNAGLGWRKLADGLTDRSIVAVALSPAYAEDRLVFAVSLGGSIWQLRDA